MSPIRRILLYEHKKRTTRRLVRSGVQKRRKTVTDKMLEKLMDGMESGKFVAELRGGIKIAARGTDITE